MVLKIWFAVQASRFFVDARRQRCIGDAALHSLTDQDIIGGQWLALKRLFYWPGLRPSRLSFCF